VPEKVAMVEASGGKRARTGTPKAPQTVDGGTEADVPSAEEAMGCGPRGKGWKGQG
jgi:hypothetical protein